MRILSQKIKQQSGITLIETLIGLALSLIVVSSMVALMGNSLGSATRIIQMTQLSDELRNTMSMLTRDLRRANYSANAVYCYANSDCGVDGNASQTAIVIENENCLIFNLDRDLDGHASTDSAGAFRSAEAGGVGFIEMWVGDDSANCDDPRNVPDDEWITMTNPDLVDITTFSVILNNITGSLTEESGKTLNQHTREFQIQIEGELILDDTISRRIEDTIRVRNDFLEHAAS